MMVTDQIEFILMLITAFAKHYQLTKKQAYRYIARYKGIDLCMEHYGIMHTLSLEDNIESLAKYCRKNGGLL